MDFERRKAIIASAARAFREHGFRKASVEEIARGAEVAKGTVYLACESKEDLFYQALHSEVRQWVAENAQLIDPRVPADDILEAMARLGVDEIERKPLVKGLLSGEYAALLPTWAERFAELRRLCTSNIVEVLQLGIRQGRLRADLDVPRIAELLLDLQISTLLFHNMPGPEREERIELRARAAFDLVLSGMRPRS